MKNKSYMCQIYNAKNFCGGILLVILFDSLNSAIKLVSLLQFYR